MGTYYTDYSEECLEDYRTTYYGNAFQPNVVGYDNNLVIKSPSTKQYGILELQPQTVKLCNQYEVQKTHIPGVFVNKISDGGREVKLKPIDVLNVRLGNLFRYTL